jgi:hypothetical protein
MPWDQDRLQRAMYCSTPCTVCSLYTSKQSRLYSICSTIYSVTVSHIKKRAIAKKRFSFLPIFSDVLKGRLCIFNYFIILLGEQNSGSQLLQSSQKRPKVEQNNRFRSPLGNVAPGGRKTS